MNEMKLTVWTRSNVKLLDTGMKYSLVETDDFTENFESKHEFSVYPFVIKSENEISRLIARLLVRVWEWVIQTQGEHSVVKPD